MKFEFTIEQVNLLLHALSKMPYEMSAEMIAELRRQAEPQVAALQKPAEAAPAAE
jgi:hypothetical protein